MIPAYLSLTWGEFVPAMKNHLWQSTLFVLVAALLTLALRKNHARTRHWLWLAASVKFLIPFSLLVSLGGHLTTPHSAAPAQTGLYLAMEEVSQPFTQQAAPAVAPLTFAPTPLDWPRLLPVFLAAAWFAGFVAVLAVWWIYWRRISAAMRGAVRLRDGREVDALRRLERIAGLRTRIELLLSPSTLGPGIYGMARPVLIWPSGISQRLDDEHLESILAHEICHVRRRDNLTAAIHMLVEAIFWFHPLAWWLGARLEEERERACDEDVLRLCNQPYVYAESILKICEFYMESPLPCVTGVTGADLKKRIVNILAQHVALKLDLSRKLLLTAVGLTAIAVPIVTGEVKATQRSSVLAHASASPTGPSPSMPRMAAGPAPSQISQCKPCASPGQRETNDDALRCAASGRRDGSSEPGKRST